MMREGWTRVSLGEVAGLRKDSAHRRNLTEEVLYLGLEHLREGGGIVHTGTGKDFTGGVLRFDCGDALYGKLRPYFRKATQASESGYCTPEIWVIQTRSQLMDQGFLFRVISSQAFTDYVNAASDGTRMPRARWDVARTFPVALPPIDEQRRIATVLGTLDDLIEVGAHLATAMNLLADQLFDSWAGDLEQSVYFGDIACRVAVKAAPKDDDLYLGLEHFGVNAAGLIGAGLTSKVVSQTSHFERGDVLYGRLRPYFRKVARPDFAGCCSTEVWVLRGLGEFPQSYIHWVARQQAFTDHANSASEGTRMPRASWAQVSQFLVPDPRQSGLLRVADAADLLWEAANQLRAETREVARAREELLPLLLSGEATVSEVSA